MTDTDLDAPATLRDIQRELKPYATKNDLQEALEPYATKDDVLASESRMDTKLDTLADMIRALGMKMDDFQKERVYRDEVQDLENRVKRVEEHTGLR